MPGGTNLFGWDLLYNSVSNDIKSESDILVCLVHLVLISNDFKCIGLGDSKTLDGNEPQSELLPKGWNLDYRLRYIYRGKLYNLHATRLDDGVMVNLIRVDERNVSITQLNNRLVNQRQGGLDVMIPTHADVTKIIQEQLINKVIVSNKSKNSSSQTTTTPQSQSSPETQNPPTRQPDPFAVSPFASHLSDPIGGVGRNDLDPLGGLGFIGPRVGGPLGPLGGGGGGMLFQPPQRGGPGSLIDPTLPPGAVPPGARFDPFRPPDVDRYRAPPQRRPDNDDFPPPGFDDMYM